jgi:hypothetical protein
LFIYLLSIYGTGEEKGPLLPQQLIGLLYKFSMIDGDDIGPVSGRMSGKGNRSTPRKPAPVPLCIKSSINRIKTQPPVGKYNFKYCCFYFH